MKERRAAGRHQNRVRRDLGERRDGTVGQGDDRYTVLNGIVGKVEGQLRIGSNADREQHILRSRMSKAIRTGCGNTVDLDGLTAGQGQDVVKMPGNGVACPEPQAVDMPGAGEGVGRSHDTAKKIRICQALDLSGDRAEHIGGKRCVALQFLAGLLSGHLAGEAEPAAAHGVRVTLPNVLVAIQAKMLCEPRHRRRLHPGLPRLLAHGQQRHVARVVQHEPRRGLKLRRHGVEPGKNFGVQRRVIHGADFILRHEYSQQMIHM